MSAVRAGDPGDPRRRPESFDTVADRYARYRRGAPPDVVADLLACCAIGPGTRVLEIGCGTGQLSVPLAEAGADLLAVDLGPALAAHARHALAAYPTARVEVGAFERWPLPVEPFDVVVSSNAFHWLDPAVRIDKAVAAVRPGGALGILQPSFVAGGTDGFFDATQPLYLRYALSDDPDFTLPPATAVRPAYPELDDDPRFVEVVRHRTERIAGFTAAQYTGMLSTDSLVLGIGKADREAFLAAIEDLVETRFGGEITRNYLYEVIVARTAGG